MTQDEPGWGFWGFWGWACRGLLSGGEDENVPLGRVQLGGGAAGDLDQTPVSHFFRRENENKRRIARNEEGFCGGIVELRRARNLTNDAGRRRLGRSQQEKVRNWGQSPLS